MGKKHIVVTGDLTIDWALRENSMPPISDAEDRLQTLVNVRWLTGGAFLLADMIEAATRGTVHVHRPDRPEEGALRAFDNPYNHSFAIISKYPVEPAENEVQRWRVKEYLGFGSDAVDINPLLPERFYQGIDVQAPPDIIVLDDSALGYRDTWKDGPPGDDVLPGLTSKDHGPWLLLKMSHRIAEGEIWSYFNKRLRDQNDTLASRFIAVTSASRLRDAGAGISRDISWERSAQDTALELQLHKRLHELSNCRRLIVSFGPSGALLIDRTEASGPSYTLVFDRERTERSWRRKNGQGTMFGYGSALCGAVAAELARSADRPKLVRAMRSGLTAMQSMYDQGFDLGNDNREKTNEFHCPASKIFEPPSAKPKDGLRLATAKNISITRSPSHSLSFLLLDSRRLKNPESADLPKRVATMGDQVLANVPVGRFGKLTVVDRREIEGLHAIRNIIARYRDGLRFGQQPLALAVFGAPGSGKSFAVEQLVESEISGQDKASIRFLEFNLSQFGGPSDLVVALHRVRDTALAGNLPVAFWDEFDTKLDGSRLGWLRHFLSPIQDGSFRQKGTVHRVGPCIFVFGGGTFHSFDDFSKAAPEAERELKVPDFLSRLRGYIDIAGVNPEPEDSSYLIRRALVLHALFTAQAIARKENSGKEFDVDPGILEALLKVPTYRHGVRSIRSIVEMSTTRPGRPFLPADLPPKSILNLHVDGDLFLKLARGDR
ncbi:hypothetical protein ACFVFS_10730 [Kitasatospora sp. NPDC057692]|uniref:hypothetical protein n=1 Tax=Kitasatospora sp. NPDC057692 TaxID=3346215 RepID=UPI00369909B3